MNIDHDHLKIFGGRAGRELASEVCAHLDISEGTAQTDLFPDGELIVRVEEDVRGRDCFVIQSTSDPVNANLMELLIYIDCLRRASAKRITAVIPYFGYARQDRKDTGRTPITAKLVANLFVAAGVDRVLCMDLHAAQIQGFFDIPVDHLTASMVLVNYFEGIRSDLGDLTIVSPDVGNVKVANAYASALNAELAIIDKRRESGETVASKNLIGKVKGKTVLMVDDLISTAGTICEAAKLVMDEGADRVIAAATHPVLCGMAMDRIKNSPIEQIVVTDSIPDRGRLEPLRDRLVELSVGPLLGEAIYRIHHDMSISALFQRGTGVKR
ncbi:MAG: ribose-phosphate pyrophosphokinase [Phycisphaerales bacterium]|nr:ribose-phosphate pyrophosphokinase [Phycisphaerales bacterium]